MTGPGRRAPSGWRRSDARPVSPSTSVARPATGRPRSTTATDSQVSQQTCLRFFKHYVKENINKEFYKKKIIYPIFYPFFDHYVFLTAQPISGSGVRSTLNFVEMSCIGIKFLNFTQFSNLLIESEAPNFHFSQLRFS